MRPTPAAVGGLIIEVYLNGHVVVTYRQSVLGYLKVGIPPEFVAESVIGDKVDGDGELFDCLIEISVSDERFTAFEMERRAGRRGRIDISARISGISPGLRISTGCKAPHNICDQGSVCAVGIV